MHTYLASEAVKYHKLLLKDTHYSYNYLTGDRDAMHVSVEEVSDATIDAFVAKACKFDFQMSSDFQKNKLMATWNESAQLG